MRKHCKKKYFVLSVVFFLICLNGCMSTLIKPEITEANRENLARLSIGMTKQQASKIMRDKVFIFGGVDITLVGAYFSPFSTIKNPHKTEILQGKNGKDIKVKYYITSAKSKSKEIPDDELTPLVFEDEKFIGWGWDFLQDQIKK